MYNFIRSSTPLTRPLTRRAILRALGAGATMAFAGGAGLLLQSCSPASQPAQSGASASSPTTTKSSNGSPAFSPDIELKLTAAPGETKILPGATTNTWSYHGEVVQGDASALINLSDTYLYTRHYTDLNWCILVQQRSTGIWEKSDMKTPS